MKEERFFLCYMSRTVRYGGEARRFKYLLTGVHCGASWPWLSSPKTDASGKLVPQYTSSNVLGSRRVKLRAKVCGVLLRLLNRPAARRWLIVCIVTLGFPGVNGLY